MPTASMADSISITISSVALFLFVLASADLTLDFNILGPSVFLFGYYRFPALIVKRVMKRIHYTFEAFLLFLL